MGGNFKFQVQDIFFGNGRFEKRIPLSEKKPPLTIKTALPFNFSLTFQ